MRLQKVARPDTIISMVCPTKNNICIDSMLDVALDSNEIVEMAIQAEQDGFDAVCLYCFSDPAIAACRECLHIPVIGGGQVSVLIAAGLGNAFSILTTSKSRISQKKEFVRTLGVDYTRLASVRSIEFPVEQKKIKQANVLAALAEEAKRCVSEDHADVVILGCLSFVGMAQEISIRVGIPVVDPGFALVNMAELLVNQGLSHSKVSYPFPPKRERQWGSGNIKL